MENNEFENQPQQEMEQPVEQPVEQPAQAASTNNAPNFLDQLKQSSVVKSICDFFGKAKQSPAADSVRNFFEKLKKIPVKIWAIAGIAVVAVVAVILAIGLFSNTYKAPLDLTVKIMNAKKLDKAMDLATDSLNGFCESEAKAIVKILKKSDLYKDNKDDIEDQLDEIIENLKDEYGSNYKISYKVTDKEKIDKDDCEDYEDQLKALGKTVTNATKEMDSDQIEDMADETGLSKSDCKKLIKEVESAGKKLRKAKVTAGYELEVTLLLKGSELDEPEEMEMTINVYKVNGRWMLDYISLAQNFLGSIMGALQF